MLKKLLLITFILFTFPTMGYEEKDRQRIASESEEIRRFLEVYKGNRGYAYVFEEGVNFKYLADSKSSKDNSSVVRRFQKASFNGGTYRIFYTHGTYRNHAVINSQGNIVQLVVSVEPTKNWNHKDLIGFISSLKNLEYLSIRFNDEAVDKIDLSKNNELRQVNLNKLSSGTVILPKVSMLEVLNSYSKKDIVFENIMYQENVKAMGISGGVFDLSEISNLKEIENLYLSYAKHIDSEAVVEISLSDLVNLERLYIPSGRNISAINLVKLKNLKILGLGGNNSYAHLTIPRNVEYLSSGGEINTKLPDLSRSKNLKTFISKKTSIKDLHGLSDLPHLEEVIIERSQLESMEGLRNLPSLKKLTINYGNLSKIDKLEGVDNLEELILTRNKIKEIKNVSHLSSLTFLRLFYNDIDSLDFNEVKDLAYCGIGLLYNPIENKLTDEDKKKLDNLYEYGNINGKQ
ncbi:leucine-rich repeat domain-containing protein [Vibrio nigripulchritudo]|uniref:leucine-rich repeat domain-containing protein n=1 Tax=Vibrio nigripulchritudo TaxID=28173 RepID=UPI0003B23D7C|nr:leucine-rich repeat domain-containing protein [Vibrio nigripulchritudo]CCN69710.1 exported hypothetical protein [Vibrio nigripulchritudo SFn118]